jgi:hypothetical protein
MNPKDFPEVAARAKECGLVVRGPRATPHWGVALYAYDTLRRQAVSFTSAYGLERHLAENTVLKKEQEAFRRKYQTERNKAR